MDTLGWQALLAAEVSPNKGLALLRELGSLSGDWASTIAGHRMLSDKERSRAREIYPDKVSRATEAGVYIVTRSSFPEPLCALPYPPALFVWGDFDCAHRPCIG